MTAEENTQGTDGSGAAWEASVTLPWWVVSALDAEVERVGGSRESVIVTWVSERASIPQGNLRRGAVRGNRNRSRD